MGHTFLKKHEYILDCAIYQKTAHGISTENGIEMADYSLLSLPLYLVEALPKVLNEIRKQAP